VVTLCIKKIESACTESSRVAELNRGGSCTVPLVSLPGVFTVKLKVLDLSYPGSLAGSKKELREAVDL
jgi:hypothetical protein